MQVAQAIPALSKFHVLNPFLMFTLKSPTTGGAQIQSGAWFILDQHFKKEWGEKIISKVEEKFIEERRKQNISESGAYVISGLCEIISQVCKYTYILTVDQS